MRNFPRMVLTTLIVLGVWSVGWAIPPMINYQGILLDDSGDPVTTTVSVLFAIWNDPAAGDSLWSESQSITPDADGLFSTLLGSINPIPDSALAGDAYISTKVGADPEMTPRTQLVSVAYAFRPGTVDGAVGGIISGDVAIQSDLDVDGELRVTGNVGIGTNAPAEKLQVIGVVHSTTGGFRFPDGSIQTVAAGGGGSAGWTDDGAVVRLDDSTDYVGVGTSAPQGPLHVDGGVAGSGSGDDIIVQGQDGSSDFLADGGNIRLIPGAEGPSGSPGKVFVGGELQVDSNKILGGSGLALHPSRSYASYGVRIQDAGANCFLEIPNSASWIVRDINFGQNRVAFTGAGDVGIGTLSPSERLHVVGNICATGTIGVCSDARYKKNVSQLSGALELLEKVRGVEFHWRRDEYPDLQFDSDRHMGFIAQEIREALPGVVSQGNDGYYAVDYGRLSPVLVEAIKELKAENALKAAEIRRLQDNLTRLEGQVQALLSDKE